MSREIEEIELHHIVNSHELARLLEEEAPSHVRRVEPAHMVLVLICGKELWIPLNREIGQQMASMLAPFLPKASE